MHNFELLVDSLSDFPACFDKLVVLFRQYLETDIPGRQNCIKVTAESNIQLYLSDISNVNLNI